VPSDLQGRLVDRLRAGRKLLIPFLTGGYPTPERFVESLCAVDAHGADAIEIGVPFSDPLADGPTIQRTSQRALEAGITLSRLLDVIRTHRSAVAGPIVLMTYANPVLRMGEEVFCRRAAESGVGGVLVTDLPPDERHGFEDALHAHGLDRIVLVAPTTTPERIDRLLPHASGFVYCITRTGVTGAGASFSDLLAAQVERIRARSTLPVVAGFGIRSGADVRALRGMVDGVVIGARLLEQIERTPAGADLATAIGPLMAELRSHLDAA
jgi:tryptophan synthase alpha chain